MSKGRLQVKESPIYCIFFSEFDPDAGPKITYQVPSDYISKEVFDSHKSYIIPKAALHGKLMSVNASTRKIIGFPIGIENPKYRRNQLIFNLCFVCDSSLRTVQYEPLVQKFANYLVKLELEDSFLSQIECKSALPVIMEKVRNELNEFGLCSITINDSSTIYLKVIRIFPEPPDIKDYDVPIFTNNKKPILPSEWDLTTQQWDLTFMQILPFIDGFKHIARIAAEADVEISLVKACIKNMVYYEVVTLIPIFMYTNVYTATPKINELLHDDNLQSICLKYVARQGCHLPTFQSVFMLYCALQPGSSVKTICLRNNPRALGIDERKLIQFGLMKGLIRRLQKYPILMSNEMANVPKNRSLTKYFTGKYCYDEISCRTGLSYLELDEKVEKDPNIVVCWR